MRHEAVRSLATGVTALAFAVALIGLAILLIAAIVEVTAGEPGMSIVDGYWIGRLPWTPIGVGMALYGATAAVVAGVTAAWLVGGGLARAVGTAAVLPVAFWWGIAPMVGFSGACCGPPPAYDPITLAYSMPESAALLVVGPAVASALALWLDRPRRASRALPDYRTVSGA
jgi:hypothetical protein